MPICNHCGENVSEVFHCSNCGQNYCAFHKNPIDHECNIIVESLRAEQPAQYETIQSGTDVRGTTDGSYTWYRQESAIPEDAFAPDSGIDFKAHMNEPVKSINRGIVAFTGNHFFSGNSVYVDHGLGIISMYFHLSEIKVKKGDEVNIGDVIGLIGSTGRSTGPHLHWGVRINNIRVDPLSLIKLNEYF